MSINFPAGQTHVVLEFRYTEALKADGVTPIENIGLGVYTGTSGVGSPRIYDATGKLVASGNATSGLAVGQWYTVIVEPGNLTGFSLWTCHGYTADAPILTMEIRTRACTADPGLWQGLEDAVRELTRRGVTQEEIIKHITGGADHA